MSLRSKTAVALCAVVAVLVSALAIVFARSSLSELRSIEEMNLADDAERTGRQIDTLLAGLSQTTADWAYWDESHQFVLDGNEDFTEENLSSEALGLISVDLAAFVSTEGTIRYGIWTVDETSGPLPETIQAAVQPGGRLTTLPPDVGDDTASRGSLVGIELVGERMMLLSVRESRSFTDPAAPGAGILVMGQEITSDEVESIAGLVGREIEITPCVESACASFAIAKSERTSGTISRVQIVDGLDGEPAVAVRVTSDRALSIATG